MSFIETYGLIKYYQGISKSSKYPRNVPCEICGSPRPIFEHCHDHGWVRGMACMSCNSILKKYDLAAKATGWRVEYWDHNLNFYAKLYGRNSETYLNWRKNCPQC